MTGPRKRNLDHTRGFQPSSTGEASNDAHRSLATAIARMGPVNKIVPPRIAGPANLWVENVWCWEMASSAIPLKIYIGRGHSTFSVNSGDPRTIYLAAVTQLVMFSGVIPGLPFNACAPKAAAEIPTAAERQ